MEGDEVDVHILVFLYGSDYLDIGDVLEDYLQQLVDLGSQDVVESVAQHESDRVLEDVQPAKGLDLVFVSPYFREGNDEPIDKERSRYVDPVRKSVHDQFLAGLEAFFDRPRLLPHLRLRQQYLVQLQHFQHQHLDAAVSCPGEDAHQHLKLAREDCVYLKEQLHLLSVQGRLRIDSVDKSQVIDGLLEEGLHNLKAIIRLLRLNALFKVILQSSEYEIYDASLQGVAHSDKGFDEVHAHQDLKARTDG